MLRKVGRFLLAALSVPIAAGALVLCSGCTSCCPGGSAASSMPSAAEITYKCAGCGNTAKASAGQSAPSC
jgi:hypothetical protein